MGKKAGVAGVQEFQNGAAFGSADGTRFLASIRHKYSFTGQMFSPFEFLQILTTLM